jgi:hypothetical protein
VSIKEEESKEAPLPPEESFTTNSAIGALRQM